MQITFETRKRNARFYVLWMREKERDEGKRKRRRKRKDAEERVDERERRRRRKKKKKRMRMKCHRTSIRRRGPLMLAIGLV